MQMDATEFVQNVLCPRTGTVPQVRHALAFRKSVAAWTAECKSLAKELSLSTGEDVTAKEAAAVAGKTALSYLDDVIRQTLLPVMQDAAVNGTLSALERSDAFEPVVGSTLYGHGRGLSLGVGADMCLACQALHNCTGPLFAALRRLPKGGEMHSPLVAVLEQAVLLFRSRVVPEVAELCRGKTALVLLEGMDEGRGPRFSTAFSKDMERRRPFAQLLASYFDEDGDGGEMIDSPVTSSRKKDSIKTINRITPSASDTKSNLANGIPDSSSRRSSRSPIHVSELDAGTDLQREQETFEDEVAHLTGILDFGDEMYGSEIVLASEEELMKAASLAHSLLRVSNLLERRLRPTAKRMTSWGNAPVAPRTLRDPILEIRTHGLRLAKFCRTEVLLQT